MSVWNFRGAYYETLETSTYDVQRPVDRRAAGRLRRPDRHAAGGADNHPNPTDTDAPSAHARAGTCLDGGSDRRG
ncbi:hypothetical protein [Candidatus Amarolinea dominans]|uniref:hypothetical protein n=1 Tax=Candidatus Amarolinea dominans TaxID=3140696 RepID=UPI0031372939|nr:hypothetical protein [Anaerolineae bacterium]